MWAPATRILHVLLDMAGMVLAIIILRTPSVFNLGPEIWRAIGNAQAAENLSRLFNLLPNLIIAIVVIATIVSVIKTLLRLFNTKSPYPVIK
jgi:hypothetical protein